MLREYLRRFMTNVGDAVEMHYPPYVFPYGNGVSEFKYVVGKVDKVEKLPTGEIEYHLSYETKGIRKFAKGYLSMAGIYDIVQFKRVVSIGPITLKI